MELSLHLGSSLIFSRTIEWYLKAIITRHEYEFGIEERTLECSIAKRYACVPLVKSVWSLIEFNCARLVLSVHGNVNNQFFIKLSHAIKNRDIKYHLKVANKSKDLYISMSTT